METKKYLTFKQNMIIAAAKTRARIADDATKGYLGCSLIEMVRFLKSGDLRYQEGNAHISALASGLIDHVGNGVFVLTWAGRCVQGQYQ